MKVQRGISSCEDTNDLYAIPVTGFLLTIRRIVMTIIIIKTTFVTIT